MTKSALPPEVLRLREVYNSDGSAKAILDDFSGRTNTQRVTKVDQIQSRLRNANVLRSEIIALFRELEVLEHGRFVEGRKGHPSRFVWSSNAIDVGKAAQGDPAPISSVSIDAAAEENEEEMRKYVFPLRVGCDANFEVPANLTAKEADRLTIFIKALAVPE